MNKIEIQSLLTAAKEEIIYSTNKNKSEDVRRLYAANAIHFINEALKMINK